MAVSEALGVTTPDVFLDRHRDVAVTDCCRTPTRIALLSRDRLSWPDAAALFPEFSAAGRPQALAIIGRALPPAELARRSRRRPVVAITPGLLQLPPVAPGRPWLSGTVAQAARDGVALPGWCEAALGAAPDGAREDARAGAAEVLAALAKARVGGAFWAPPLPGDRLVTLVCLGPGADAASGHAALAAALAGQDAAATVILADAAPRKILALARRRGCRVLTGLHDPWSAIERAGEIHLAGDHPIGLLARFAGRAPHYHTPAWHEAAADPIAAAAAWLAGTRFRDPYTSQPASCLSVIAALADWRPTLQANRAIACCVGMSVWKRRRIAGFFHDGMRAPPFRRHAGAALALARVQQAGDPAGGAIAVWNSRIPPGLPAAAAAAGVRLLRVEDGFIRSVGLGSDFLPPSSIIADASGIYYDPRQPSDLERLLAETRFDRALLDRAARLIERLCTAGVTKYAAAGADSSAAFVSEMRQSGRRILLVPGQVADDLSVRLGAGPIRSNLSLLRHVRAENSEAIVIYKPHPDVVAGHRPGAIAAADMRHLADHVVYGGAMSPLIDAVDEIHTMTSLAGFEALLRRRIVCVYGQPFYAGWGLTRDQAPIARRVRRLTLEELAACVLILYPRYLDPVTALPCGPELLIDRLAAPHLWRPGWLMRARQMQGRLRKLWQSGVPAAEIDVADGG